MRLSGTKATAIHQYRGLGNQLWDLAGNRPSLDLRFADSKSLVDATTGTNLVDFTRASSGTYVSSDGLIKTATTNYLLQSEDFSTTWSADGVCAVSTDQILSPIGTLTADKITVDAGGPNRVSQTPTFQVSAGGTYIISAYVKTLDINIIGIRIFLSGSDAYADYHFANNSFSVTNSTILTQTGYTPLSDGWTRIFVKYEPTVSGSVSIRIGGGFGGSSTSGSFYLWGAQLEQSSTVGEYVKTTSAINSAPRFDHDPTTGESLGLLVEEQRTNLITDSSLTTIGGLYASTISSTTETNPEGIDFCRRLLSDAGSSTFGHRIHVAASSANNITVSAFVKKDTHRYVHIGFGGVANSFTALFDIDPTVTGDRLLGQGGNGTYTNIDAGYQNFPNGWVRIWAAGTASGTDGTTIGFSPDDSTYNITNWAAAGTEAFFIHGVQYEDNATFPTSYIPTTTSAVTRAADVASISGSNFSSWYRQDQGTFYADVLYKDKLANTRLFYTEEASIGFNSRHGLVGGGNSAGSLGPYGETVILGSTQAGLNQGGPTANTRYKAVFAYAQDDFAFTRNGSAPVTDTSGNVPTAQDYALIGSQSVGNAMCSPIRRLTYWPTRLPNETLETITN